MANVKKLSQDWKVVQLICKKKWHKQSIRWTYLLSVSLGIITAKDEGNGTQPARKMVLWLPSTPEFEIPLLKNITNKK